MKKLRSLPLLLLFLIHVEDAFAQGIKIEQPPNTGFQVGSQTGSQIAQKLFSNTITIIFSIASLAVLIMLVWGSFDWITSAGDKEKIKSARTKITTAIIGAVLLSLSFFIARVLGDIIGIKFLGELKLPSLL